VFGIVFEGFLKGELAVDGEVLSPWNRRLVEIGLTGAHILARIYFNIDFFTVVFKRILM